MGDEFTDFLHNVSYSTFDFNVAHGTPNGCRRPTLPSNFVQRTSPNFLSSTSSTFITSTSTCNSLRKPIPSAVRRHCTIMQKISHPPRYRAQHVSRLDQEPLRHQHFDQRYPSRAQNWIPPVLTSTGLEYFHLQYERQCHIDATYESLTGERPPPYSAVPPPPYSAAPPPANIYEASATPVEPAIDRAQGRTALRRPARILDRIAKPQQSSPRKRTVTDLTRRVGAMIKRRSARWQLPPGQEVIDLTKSDSDDRAPDEGNPHGYAAFVDNLPRGLAQGLDLIENRPENPGGVALPPPKPQRCIPCWIDNVAACAAQGEVVNRLNQLELAVQYHTDTAVDSYHLDRNDFLTDRAMEKVTKLFLRHNDSMRSAEKKARDSVGGGACAFCVPSIGMVKGNHDHLIQWCEETAHRRVSRFGNGGVLYVGVGGEDFTFKQPPPGFI